MSPRIRGAGRGVCWLASLLIAVPVRAEDSAPARVTPAENPPAPGWYGTQVLIADAAGLAVGASLALALDRDRAHRPSNLGLVGSAWYGIGAVAAPAVHFAQDGFGRGAASFATRALLPPLVGVIGLGVGCIGREQYDSGCGRSGATAGTLVGLAAAAAFDASVLAYRDTGAESEKAKTKRHWYGWELLALDGALLLGGVYLSARPPKNDDGKELEPQLGPWATDYTFGLFGGPIVHALHGEWLHGLASLGARALVGPIGALPGLMGHCAASAGVRGCTSTGATFGLLGGLLLVDLFDAFVLGYEDVEPAAAARATPHVSAGPGFIAISGELP